MPHELRASARELVSEFTQLLNGTVCDGVKLTGVPSYTEVEGPIVIIGYRISAQRTFSRLAMPLCIDRKNPNLWLGFSMRLGADAENRYLMVRSSVMYVATQPEGIEPLFHIDYERDKPDGYPESHVQINASSDDWETIRTTSGEAKGLSRLHFPAGGRRYRPTLEDLITFLVEEKLVRSRDRWREVVDTSAKVYAEKQLRAAVRNDPLTAIAALKDHPPDGVDLADEFS